MQPTRSKALRKRDPERGAALVVSLITLTGLLAIGAITLLSVQSELQSSGATRFEQSALYAAESGVAAGMEFLRTSCTETALFSQVVEPSNVNPQMPAHPNLYGNNVQPGATGNPFAADTEQWYQVVVLNNFTDLEYEIGNDSDGIVILRSTGYGPNQTQMTIEVDVQNQQCIAAFCGADYTQQNASATNVANPLCTAQATNATTEIDLSAAGGAP
jgi:hypothetical protein